MKISVDAMGGDFAPQEIVQGAVVAAREHRVGIILVGPEERIKAELAKHDTRGLDIEIVHTDEYLIEGEHPAYAMRKKRNASILLATKLVKEGRADAVVGVGPTGGVVASAMQVLGTVEGIGRPVVGGPFLGFTPNTVMIDLGGNVDCRPDQLLDFGIVGTVFAQKWLNIPNPTVALLSNGAEEGKGNEVIREAYTLFKNSGLNFIGYVEGYGIGNGQANVIICDGLIGNIVVKYTETLGQAICRWLEGKLVGKLSPADIKALTDELTLKTDLADAVGGGPLWAVNGVACVAHGRSHWPEVAKAIGAAKRAVEVDLVGALKRELAAIRGKVQVPTAQ
ncbi:MAG: phosphate acyltransferase PlsX [Chloroflexi bacterium]|nr:phosphate acyltransferase PlsX [Chloroflexota bacterium]